MELSIVDAFNQLGADTKSHNSGSHYVPCPECSKDRKKKSAKSLLLNFNTGYMECFHQECFKGFAQNYIRKDGKNTEIKAYTPPPKLAQQFFPEEPGMFSWVFADATIYPVPEDPRNPTDPSTVTWYYRNIKGQLTGAKRMQYHFGAEMKRVKDAPPLHVGTRDAGYYPCLFYEHNLTLHPSATVILVESEKTAALLTHKFKPFLNEFIYLAVGGAKGLTDDKMQVLRGRNVWIAYDCDNGTPQADGTIKDAKGREGAKDAYEKLSNISNPRVIDIAPEKDDGTDLGDVYRTISIQDIRDYGKIVPDEIKTLWQQTRVTNKPTEIPPLISVQGIPTIRLRNLSLIIGKKKSRKTLFIVWMLCEAIKQGVLADEILLFDTEQDEFDVWLVKDRIFRLTGKEIAVFTVVNQGFKLRKEMISKTILHWEKTPKICVIDGIRDLMRDINSIEETTDIIDWLQNIKGTYGTHVMCILHQNKTSKDARGHIGTELLNKAEITIELERDEKTQCTMVKVESARKKHFEPFAFTHSSDDLPEIVDAPVAGNLIPVDERKKRLASIFEDGALKHGELKKLVMAEFGAGGNKALVMIREFLRNGWVIKSGKDGGKDTVYKLITSDSEKPPYAPEEQAQLTLDGIEDTPF